MQSGSRASTDTATLMAGCTFCQRNGIARYILKETANFRILADHAPLVPGHALIVPINHYTCYGDVPDALEAEFLALKQEMQRFFTRHYAPTSFWEHGIFRQTVFHAHLHCFPFGDLQYNHSAGLHEVEVRAQEDIRNWHRLYGNYFYLEDTRSAFLFAPRADHYSRIFQEVLIPGTIANNRGLGWLLPQERREISKPFIEELQTKWQQFQDDVADGEEID